MPPFRHTPTQPRRPRPPAPVFSHHGAAAAASLRLLRRQHGPHGRVKDLLDALSRLGGAFERGEGTVLLRQLLALLRTGHAVRSRIHSCCVCAARRVRTSVVTMVSPLALTSFFTLASSLRSAFVPTMIILAVSGVSAWRACGAGSKPKGTMRNGGHGAGNAALGTQLHSLCGRDVRLNLRDPL
jgi:hypothetical protein